MISRFMVRSRGEAQIEVWMKEVYVVRQMTPENCSKPVRTRYMRIYPVPGWFHNMPVDVDLFAGKYVRADEGAERVRDPVAWSDQEVLKYALLIHALNCLSRAEAELEALQADYEADRHHPTEPLETTWGRDFHRIRTELLGRLDRLCNRRGDQRREETRCELGEELNMWTVQCYNNLREAIAKFRENLQERLDLVRVNHLGPPVTTELQEDIHNEGHLAVSLLCSRDGLCSSMKSMIEGCIGLNLFKELTDSRLFSKANLPKLWRKTMTEMNAKLLKEESAWTQLPFMRQRIGTLNEQQMNLQKSQQRQQISLQRLERRMRCQDDIKPMEWKNIMWNDNDVDCSAIKLAVYNDENSFQCLKKDVRNDIDFFQKMICQNWRVVRFFSPEWSRPTQKDIFKKAIQQEAAAARYMPHELLNDESFMMELVIINWKVAYHAPDWMGKNIWRNAGQRNVEARKCMPEKFR